MYKLGVIGDKDTVLAFKALGLSTFPVSSPDEGERALENMAKENYAVIFITEQIAESIKETIDKFEEEILPSIILIPNNQGPLGIGMQNVRSSVEKAIGVDIF
ncbi:MAG TPA: V-type ATP synthase subunit F, partial [Thermoanaerobacterales bacterium]|nr:V-type ATP synthase subunit F [Thermoanaerobacterales bacterium]